MWRGAASTEKMKVKFEDEEFKAVDGESRVSEPNKQCNDQQPEFTGASRAVQAVIEKKVKLCLLFTRIFFARASCFKQADRPSVGCLRRTGTRGCGH